MIASLGLLLLQQSAFLGNTSPASGDTTGYWQQSVKYAIVATLDEERMATRARGEMIYVNNSPDTLREMYVHQYLNAFRPGSKWSASDVKENRVRFQNLAEPNYGYERFTSPPTVDGTPVTVTYPGAPDSTVARFALPRPLPPGGTVKVAFAWEARPSTVFRRQGRRGRTYDFAQWYPKVAVYDRGGWQPNALVPAGELYGEFGEYDVTLIVRDDQIVGATGVPVRGDPGWGRVSRTGPPRLAEHAYDPLAEVPLDPVPAGYRAVRFHARDVHHFAWTASTEYRYEGGVYVRERKEAKRYPTFDTVSVHVLFKPGDDSTWGGGIALRRTIDALRWLEGIYGPFTYPQVTNVHRLDRGATEFPMMIMNSTASYGLILHELGHNYTYGILANNEWRSGFLDEGFTDYQTYWAQGLTPQEQVALRATRPPALLARGYRANGSAIAAGDDTDELDEARLDLMHRTQPIGTNSADFSEFGIYNEMIYTRARMMYAHLRDMMGDSVFVRFLHSYYDTWALKHVDERALRTAASRAYGQDLGWFFDQWVHETGLLDYSLNSVSTQRDASGRYVTSVEVERRGEYVHPMPVGIHTSRGWSIARARIEHDRQILQVTTSEPPDSVAIDPFHVTWDWDRRNDVADNNFLILARPKIVADFPFLAQAHRDRTLLELSPLAWPTRPQNAVIGFRARTNYLGNIDRFDLGFGYAEKNPPSLAGAKMGPINRLHAWLRIDNPYLPFTSRPLMDFHLGLAHLDGILEADAAKSFDLSPFLYALGPTLSATVGFRGAYPTRVALLPEQWSDTRTSELFARGSFASTPTADSVRATATLELGVGHAAPRAAGTSRGYGRATGSVTSVTPLVMNRRSLTMRLAAGWTPRAPLQRSEFASSQDPLRTFSDNFYRPRGALFKQTGSNYRPLGGAGLRGFSPYLALDQYIAANGEVAERVRADSGQFGRYTAYVTAFADAGAAHVSPESPLTTTDRFFADGGLGVLVRGRLYDRDVAMRLDFPIALSRPSLGQGHASNGGPFAVRWAFSFNDLR